MATPVTFVKEALLSAWVETLQLAMIKGKHKAGIHTPQS